MRLIFDKDYQQNYKCCKCGEPLEEGGPINTYLKKLVDQEVPIRPGNEEVTEGHTAPDKGFKATFKIKPNAIEDTAELDVTIFCWNCKRLCEY